MQRVPCRGSTDIRHDCTKFSHHSDLVPGMRAHVRVSERKRITNAVKTYDSSILTSLSRLLCTHRLKDNTHIHLSTKIFLQVVQHYISVLL